MSFCAFVHLVTTFIFFSAWDKSRVKWDNSQNLTQKVRTMIFGKRHINKDKKTISEIVSLHCFRKLSCEWKQLSLVRHMRKSLPSLLRSFLRWEFFFKQWICIEASGLCQNATLLYTLIDTLYTKEGCNRSRDLQ
jgi:hypothetical protein